MLVSFIASLLQSDTSDCTFDISKVALGKTHIEDRDLWQVLQGLPLPADVVDGADDDHVLELVVVEVGCPEGHDEVPEADEGAVRVGEEADDHVAVEDRHGRLVAVQDAVLDGARRRPVEHARRVVLHLRLLEVKVLGLRGGRSVVM